MKKIGCIFTVVWKDGTTEEKRLTTLLPKNEYEQYKQFWLEYIKNNFGDAQGVSETYGILVYAL